MDAKCHEEAIKDKIMAKKKHKMLEIKVYDVGDIITAEYNPRKLSKKKERELRESLEKYGLREPLKVNINPDRKNILISGHQRLKIWSDLGYDKVPVTEENLSYEDEKEMNLRWNKNGGEFDMEKVSELFPFERLLELGFGKNELPDMLSDFEKKFEEVDVDEPTYPIIPKFNESYNMVSIFCETEMDYTWLKNVLGIEKRKCYKSSTLGESQVVTVKDFQKIWKDAIKNN